MEWISVDDYLPCYGQSCILTTKEEVLPYIMTFDSLTANCDGFSYGNGLFELTCGEVTHWMPLPEPPKEK